MFGIDPGGQTHLLLVRGDSALHPNPSWELSSMAQLSGATATFGCHLVLRKKTSPNSLLFREKVIAWVT